MVDAGEAVTATLKREFGEEALNSLEASDSEKKQIEKRISDIFTHGKEVSTQARQSLYIVCQTSCSWTMLH